MLRDNSATAAVEWETPTGEVLTAGGQSPKRSTRRKFPQTSADLTVRWCSAYLKIDVAKRVFANDPRFREGHYVLVTGERAEESTSRARYATMERHSASNRRRRVVQWRPVHGWPESEVWAILRRWGIVPHPAYQIGFGRVSCMSCIFGNPGQWATVRDLNPEHFARLAAYEEEFGSTIRRKESIVQSADRGRSYLRARDHNLAAMSQRDNFEGPVIVPTDAWELPRGAYRKDSGPI